MPEYPLPRRVYGNRRFQEHPASRLQPPGSLGALSAGTSRDSRPSRGANSQGWRLKQVSTQLSESIWRMSDPETTRLNGCVSICTAVHRQNLQLLRREWVVLARLSTQNVPGGTLYCHRLFMPSISKEGTLTAARRTRLRVRGVYAGAVSPAAGTSQSGRRNKRC